MQLDERDAVTRLLEGFPDPTWSVAAGDLLVGWNPAAEVLFGFAPGEVLGRPVVDVLGPVPLTAGPVQLRDSRGRPVPGSVVVWSDGAVRHTSWRPSPRDDSAVSRAWLGQLLDQVSDAVVTVDPDGFVLSVNSAAERLYGVRSAEVVGRHLRVMTRSAGADAYLAAAREALLAGLPWRGVETELTTGNGRTLLVDSAATAVWDGHGGYAGAVLVSRDVNRERELEESLRAATRAFRDRAAQIARAPYRDALTGVAPRTLLQERLAAALSAADASGEPVCVLVTDLNGFRGVNEAYGLTAGDALLTAFAAHLRSCVPSTATAGRLGADEFAVVLPGVEEEAAHRIARTVQSWTPPSPLPARGRRAEDPDVGVSVGVVQASAAECRSPFDSGVRSVLHRAETVVAEAKRRPS